MNQIVHLKLITDPENPIFYPFVENIARNWKNCQFVDLGIKLRPQQRAIADNMWRFHVEMFKLYQDVQVFVGDDRITISEKDVDKDFDTE